MAKYAGHDNGGLEISGKVSELKILSKWVTRYQHCDKTSENIKKSSCCT